MAKGIKFRLESKVKVVNPVVKQLNTNPQFTRKRELDKTQDYKRKRREPIDNGD